MDHFRDGTDQKVEVDIKFSKDEIHDNCIIKQQKIILKLQLKNSKIVDVRKNVFSRIGQRVRSIDRNSHFIVASTTASFMKDDSLFMRHSDIRPISLASFYENERNCKVKRKLLNLNDVENSLNSILYNLVQRNIVYGNLIIEFSNNSRKYTNIFGLKKSEENINILRFKFTGHILAKNQIYVDILLDRYYPLDGITSIDKVFNKFQKDFIHLQKMIMRLPVKKPPNRKKNSVYFLKPPASCLFLHETIGHPLEYSDSFKMFTYDSRSHIDSDLKITINNPIFVKNLYNFDDDGIEPRYTTLIKQDSNIISIMNLNNVLKMKKYEKKIKNYSLSGNSRSEYYESPQVRQGHITIEEGRIDLIEEKENFTGISFYNCRDGGYYNHLNISFIVLNGIYYKKGSEQFLVKNLRFESTPAQFLTSIYEIGKKSESIIIGCGKNSSIIPVGVQAPCLKIIL